MGRRNLSSHLSIISIVACHYKQTKICKVENQRVAESSCCWVGCLMLRDFQAYIGRSTQAGGGVVMVRVDWVSVSVRGANTQSGAGIAQVALSL